MKSTKKSSLISQIRSRVSFAAISILMMTISTSALAVIDDAKGTSGAVCTFFKNINAILNIASLAVVTIAVIFAGYQIAFAHKRISDVAPVLIGAVLIGGAAQFAKMILPTTMGEGCLTFVQAIQPFYA